MFTCSGHYLVSSPFLSSEFSSVLCPFSFVICWLFLCSPKHFYYKRLLIWFSFVRVLYFEQPLDTYNVIFYHENVKKKKKKSCLKNMLTAFLKIVQCSWISPCSMFFNYFVCAPFWFINNLLFRTRPKFVRSSPSMPKLFCQLQSWIPSSNWVCIY